MQKHRIIHRDLKLKNLFLSEDMVIKIGDFGLATKLDYAGQKKYAVCGTPNYIAPEFLESKRSYSSEVDIWSLGVIIYFMLYGRYPFESDSVQETYELIKNNEFIFPENIPVNPMAKDLISRMLVTEPSLRYTIYDVENHPFLNGPGMIPKKLCRSLVAQPPSELYI